MNRILLVDDETDINLLFKIVLEDRGFKVDTFEENRFIQTPIENEELVKQVNHMLSSN
jgi:DNA-binding response OmpR family regulator